MGNKPFTLIAAVLFALAALVHLYRLFKHFTVIVGSHTLSETVSIVQGIVFRCAIVEAERLFIDIAEQVKWFDCNICPAQSALEA